MSGSALGPQIIETDEAPATTAAEPAAPRIVEADAVGQIAAADPPSNPTSAPEVRQLRHLEPFRVAVLGLAILIGGLLTVEAINWLSAQFARSFILGLIAISSLGIGLSAIIYWTLSELRSLARLREVQTTQAILGDAPQRLPPSAVLECIEGALKALPKTAGITGAVSAYKRQLQPHHSIQQQIELLSRVALAPADERAKALIRQAALQMIGVTTISPKSFTDSLFFFARGVRLLRQVAECYGHRPGIAATTHLVRRLFFGAAMLGATDFVVNSGVELLGNTVLEKLSAKVGESVVTAQRMARFGIASIRLCRPIVLARADEPTLAGLIGGIADIGH